MDSSSALLLAVALTPTHISTPITSTLTPASSTASTSKPSPSALENLCLSAGGWEFIDTTSTQKMNEFGEKVGWERLKEALEAGEWDSASASAFPSVGGGLGENGKMGAEDEILVRELEAELGIGDLEDVEAEDDTSEKGSKGFKTGGGEGSVFSGEGRIERGKEMREPILGRRKRDDEDGGDEVVEDRENSEGEKWSQMIREGEDGSGDKPGEGQDDEDVEDLSRFLTRLQAVRETGKGLPEEERKKLAARTVMEVMKGL